MTVALKVFGSVGQTLRHCTFSDAVPVLPDTDAFSCLVFFLTRYVPPWTTWVPLDTSRCSILSPGSVRTPDQHLSEAGWIPNLKRFTNSSPEYPDYRCAPPLMKNTFIRSGYFRGRNVLFRHVCLNVDRSLSTMLYVGILSTILFNRITACLQDGAITKQLLAIKGQ